MKRTLALTLLLTLLFCGAGFCEAFEGEDDRVYTMVDEAGAEITQRMGCMYEGDEYISGDNRLYRVISVDDENGRAVAQCLGDEPGDAVSAFAALADKADTKKLICMYSTHSDESYIPGDGESSLLKGAGIYDVGEALKKNLEEKGIDVTYSRETFLPHDAGAYRRSRSVAAELMEKNPDALIDIHRDGVPASQYETEVEGNDISKVRLFVGKSNADAAENRAFAKKLKAVADDEYPGLVKDIYIGKGNYNQDLYPRAILLEFGTHKIEKQKAIDATEYMADVIYQTLYNEKSAAGKTGKEEKSGAAKGIGWLIGLAIVAAIAFALVATGSFRGAGDKLKGTFREVTGGAFGGKKKKE